MDKKIIQNNFEQIGDLQKNLGLLDNIDNKSLGELATIFPRSKFTGLEDSSYYSMLESLKDNVVPSETISELAPDMGSQQISQYGEQMFNLFKDSGKEFKLKDEIYSDMPNNNIINMDSPDSLTFLDRLDKQDREESLYGRLIDEDEEEV